MRLSNFKKRLLMVAAVGKKFTERAWLLEAMTVVSEYTHKQLDISIDPGASANVLKADVKETLTPGDIVQIK